MSPPPGRTGERVAVIAALLALPVSSPSALEARVAQAAAQETATQSKPAPSEATDVTRAEIESVLAVLGDSIDQQVKVVDVGSDTNVAVGVLHRRAMSSEGESIRGLVHHDVTEVYYVLEGSGTLVTGGSLEEARAFPADSAVVTELVGPSSGGSSRGATSRRISQGDVVIIPAGIFHAFSEIQNEIRYLSIRVDPAQVLPAGYVHPALRD